MQIVFAHFPQNGRVLAFRFGWVKTKTNADAPRFDWRKLPQKIINCAVLVIARMLVTVGWQCEMFRNRFRHVEDAQFLAGRVLLRQCRDFIANIREVGIGFETQNFRGEMPLCQRQGELVTDPNFAGQHRLAVAGKTLRVIHPVVDKAGAANIAGVGPLDGLEFQVGTPTRACEQKTRRANKSCQFIPGRHFTSGQLA